MNVVWVSLIFMVVCHATGAKGNIHSMLRQLDEQENDPRTTQSEKDKLDEYRTTLIKQEILRMLGLESPPNISHIPHIPKQTLDSVLHQTAGKRDTRGGDSKQVIVMAEPDSSWELQNTETLLMHFHANVKLGSFSSATLLLRRNREVLTNKLLKKHRLLIVRIFGLRRRPSQLIGHPKIIEVNRNWVKLDITSILKSKRSDNTMTNVSVEVICEECGNKKGFVNSKKRRPLLIFKMKPVTTMRKRRASKRICHNKCCLIQYKVSFSDIGYNFIVQPQNFFLNYCKGPCTSRGGQSLFLMRINLLNPKKKTNPNDNCCVVGKLNSLSIVYQTSAGVIKKNIKDVTAHSCECA